MDLRSATHEQAVSAIKNAANPVRFVVQSLQNFAANQVHTIDCVGLKIPRLGQTENKDTYPREDPKFSAHISCVDMNKILVATK